MRKKATCLVLAVFFSANLFSADQAHFTINWGASSRQGKRPTTEDAHTALLNFNNNSKEAFFAVYDGHGGSETSKTLALGSTTFGYDKNEKIIQPLHQLIAESDHQNEERYCNAYELIDLLIRESHEHSGSTAVTAHIIQVPEPVIWIAWAGDSRAMLVQNDGTINQADITSDHRPNVIKERERILATGGSVYHSKKGTWRAHYQIQINIL